MFDFHSVQICSGLFAIFRSDTKNYAMFDPGFCGEYALFDANREAKLRRNL